ncbi:MAG TPA: hypothetical protein VJ908_00945, partial [Wenzhouxiangellaceae bacterium]|nr:hypothetical protein [Wenzhouxiangellaceae bacterium]
MTAIIAVLSILYSVSSLAQPVDFDVLVDTDRNAVNGCSVTPTGGAPLGGFEHRIRASVDLSSFEVVALEQSSCNGGSFG